MNLSFFQLATAQTDSSNFDDADSSIWYSYLEETEPMSPKMIFLNNFRFQKNLIRFERESVIELRYLFPDSINLDLEFSLITPENTLIPPNQNLSLSRNIIFNQLQHDSYYDINVSFDTFSINLGRVYTKDFVEDPFESTLALSQVLDQWYETPAESRLDLASYVYYSPNVSYFEKVASIQAFWDLHFLPNELLQEGTCLNFYNQWRADNLGLERNTDAEDDCDLFTTLCEFRAQDMILNWVDYRTIDKCICQYSFTNRTETDKRTFKEGNFYYHEITDQPKEYFSLGGWGLPWRHNNTFFHLRKGFAGPAKSIEFNFNSASGKFSSLQRSSGRLSSDPSQSENNHFAEIVMTLRCDGVLPAKLRNRVVLVIQQGTTLPDGVYEEYLQATNPTPAEACVCEKTIELCYRYDSELKVQAIENQGGGESALTAQDYVKVRLDITGKPTELIRAALISGKANCKSDPIAEAANSTSIVAKDAEILALSQAMLAEQSKSNPDDVKIAKLSAKIIAKNAEKLQLISAKSALTANCTSDDDNIGISGCKTIILKANQTASFRMASDYKIDASGKNAFKAFGSIKSDFYISATLALGINTTANEKKYCCSKRWGRYALGGFDGAPATRSDLRLDVANNFRTAAPNQWSSPHNYINTPGTSFVHDFDIVTGSTFCNDLIFNNNRIAKEKSLIDATQVYLLISSAIAIDGLEVSHKNDKELQANVAVNITDMWGSSIYTGVLSLEKSNHILGNLALRKAMYLVTLSNNSYQKTFKLINYE